jgi:chromosome segregation ATPase
MSETPDTNALLDRVDAAMKLIEITRRERDEATTKLQQISSELQMWRDGNILHENHRDEIDKLKHELDIELERSNHYRDKWQTAIRERDEAKMKLKEEEYESGKYWAQLKITIDERDEALRERDEAINEMNRYKRQWEESRSENVEEAQ